MSIDNGNITRLRSAQGKIRALETECKLQGWDGNGAEPLSPHAASKAIELLKVLPVEVPLPEFAPEPDGSISLDWIQSRDRLVSVSVGDGSGLAYAWLDGPDRGHGVAQFDGNVFPRRILDEIRGLAGYAEPAVRSA